jgi:hypothetical protein
MKFVQVSSNVPSIAKESELKAFMQNIVCFERDRKNIQAFALITGRLASDVNNNSGISWFESKQQGTYKGG